MVVGGTNMMFRRFGVFASFFLFLCIVAVGTLSAISRASAQSSFPFPGGGTLTCGVSSCTVVGGIFNGGTGTFNSSTGAFSANFGNCTVTGSTITGSFSASPGCASSAAAIATLGQSAQNVSQIGIGAVHSMITGVRDSLQRGKNTSPVALRYSWDGGDEEAMNYSSSKGMSKSPVFKAMPKQQPQMLRTVTYGIWGQGFGDVEWRSGTFAGADIGRTTTTAGGIGGADVIVTNVFSATDAVVFGALGGFTSARVKNADGSTAIVEGPGVGAYAIYVNGGFSTDATFKVDFFELNRSTGGLPDLNLGLTNFTTAYNLNYKFDLKPWWWEPTVGFSYSNLVWDNASKALGFENGHTIRVQGGIRTGTSFDWNGVTVEPTLTAMAYSDVEISGGTIAVAAGTPALAPTDEGKVFGQGIAKVNFIWNKNFSSYLEGEVRGRDSVLGAAGRLGLRYAF
jgi:hypothetical protein